MPPKRKRSLAAIKALLKEHVAGLTKHRDDLRALKDDIDDEISDASEAIEHLEESIGVLSRRH